MKESFNVKGKKGSIAIFVLVGLLFMSSFLIVSYAYNVNKSKIAKEQFNIISDIYSHKDGDANAYERAYTALRKQNKQTLTAFVEDSSTLELNRTYEENLVNYRIYGKGMSIEGYKQIITELTNDGFLPMIGSYPTTNTTYPNAKYEIIEIKQGQTFNLNYTCSEFGNLRIRCIDSETNEVVCDLVNDGGEEEKGKDYFKTTIYYSYTKENDGYITAKKDFKIGIMYIVNMPDDFKLEIESNGQAKLPEEYKQVEYIQNTWTQYIDTGYIPNNNTSIEIKASNESTSNATLYCARTGVTNKSYTAFLIGGNKLRVDYNNNNTSYQNIMTANQDTAYIYKQDKNKVYVDGELLKTLAEEEFSSEYSMYLMASHSKGTGIANIGKMKLYYCRIWDNGIIVRDFIPCYKNENGVDIPGLYDTVEGVFYTSKVADQFEKGKDVPGVGDLITNTNDENFGKYKIDIKTTKENEEDTVAKQIILDRPLFDGEYIDFKSQKVVKNDGTEENIELPELLAYEDYTKVKVLAEETPLKIEVEYLGYTISEIEKYIILDYIEGSGTQYIDTGYIMKDNSVFECMAAFLEGGKMLYYGAIEQLEDDTYLRAHFGESGHGATIWGTYNVYAKIDNDGDWHTYRFSPDTVNIDGTNEVTSTLKYPTISMYLFKRNSNFVTGDSAAKSRVKYVKIWEDGKCIRDFVPCKRRSDGVIGLYDKVNKQFYTNAGTGEFIAGPEV